MPVNNGTMKYSRLNWLSYLYASFSLVLLAGCDHQQGHGDHKSESSSTNICNSDGSTPQLAIRKPWVRAAGENRKISVGYFTLCNSTNENDRLLAIETDSARASELHKTTRSEDGRTSMRPSGPVDIPAQGQKTFEANGNHLMLIDLTAPLIDGSQISLEFVFEKAGRKTVTVPVKSDGPNTGDSHDNH